MRRRILRCDNIGSLVYDHGENRRFQSIMEYVSRLDNKIVKKNFIQYIGTGLCRVTDVNAPPYFVKLVFDELDVGLFTIPMHPRKYGSTRMRFYEMPLRTS